LAVVDRRDEATDERAVGHGSFERVIRRAVDLERANRVHVEVEHLRARPVTAVELVDRHVAVDDRAESEPGCEPVHRAQLRADGQERGVTVARSVVRIEHVAGDGLVHRRDGPSEHRRRRSWRAGRLHRDVLSSAHVDERDPVDLGACSRATTGSEPDERDAHERGRERRDDAAPCPPADPATSNAPHD
jgi:hypothetical protein